MHPFKPLIYLTGYVVPLSAALGIYLGGLWAYGAVIIAFGIFPFLEAILPAPDDNHPESAVATLESRRLFDFVLYVSVPIQYGIVGYFLYAVATGQHAGPVELVGWILSVGVSCVMLGINAGHELGHRTRRSEKRMSQALLLTSLYLHFFIEHNRGHHRHVATPLDPASARRGEWLYPFWWRSVSGGFLSAWQIEAKRLRNSGHPHPYGFANQMLRFMLVQVAALVAIGLVAGPIALGAFILAATVGFLLLETVNYLEHYGLQRRFDSTKQRYEKVQPHHSWNSNHLLGRLLLFELPRHSDHHAHAARRYQGLRYFERSPQMPAGYPAMILLAMVPPLWFYVMHRQIDRLPENINAECGEIATAA